jgi:RNA polymerase sigma factor (sigma-70 family)
MELTLNAGPVSAAQDDGRLVAAARQGDDRAFEQLYARYRERIHAFILSKVRDHGRAEDIAQDVFMSALRQMRCTDQDLAFKPWLYTIARNACIDEFRRGSRATEVPVESEEDLDASAAQGPLLSAVPTPVSAVESKQKLDDLRGALQGLTESQHQLLVMREFEGLSYDEIGDRLGMTKQMVESGLFRARRKLSEEYDELASGRRCEQIQTAIDAGALQVVKGMGIRDRRRYARHLAHCQPCRHVALMTGVDDTLLTPRRLVDKVAVLLPFPFVRRFFGHGGGAAHAGATGAAAQVASVAISTGASIGAGQAATIAALAVAGAGGGLLATHALHHHPAVHRSAPAAAPSGTAVPVVAHAPLVATRHAASAATTRKRTLRHAVIPASVVHARVARQTAVSAAPTVTRHAASAERNPVATAPATAAPTATTPTATAPTATTPTATAGAGSRTLTTTAPTAPRSTRSTPIGSAPTTITPTTPDPVQTTVDGTKKAVNGTLGAVRGAVKGTVTTVGSTVDSIATTAGSTVTSAVGVLTGTGTSGATAATTPSSTTPNPVSSTVNGATSVATGTVNGVTATVTGPVGGLPGTGTTSTTSGS